MSQKSDKNKRNKLEWKNIYYMLCYCIDEVVYFKDADVEYEKLNSTNDLLASLLCSAFESLYKNEYIKDYNVEQIITDKPRGRIDIPKSITTGSLGRAKLICSVSNMGIDNKLNRIIKASFSVLIESNKTSEDKINDDLVYRLYKYKDMLKNVSDIDISSSEINRITNVPEQYKPIFSICKLILNDWIASDKGGRQRILKLKDEDRLCYIWQKYLLNFCKNEFKHLEVSNPTFDDGWVKNKNGDRQVRHRYVDLLINNRENKKAVIADAKYYSLGNGNSASNIDQVNKYGDIFIKDNKGYETIGLLLIASNEDTDNIGETSGDQIVVYSYNININQDKDSMENDIINIIKRYI